jgi:myo-inositol catabolism protein IolS
MARNIGVIAREPLANGYLTGKYGTDRVFGAGDFRGQAHRATRQQLARQVENLRSQLEPDETLVAYALEFALANPAVSVVIPGCRTPDQVSENLALAEKPLHSWSSA